MFEGNPRPLEIASRVIRPEALTTIRRLCGQLLHRI